MSYQYRIRIGKVEMYRERTRDGAFAAAEAVRKALSHVRDDVTVEYLAAHRGKQSKWYVRLDSRGYFYSGVVSLRGQVTEVRA